MDDKSLDELTRIANIRRNLATVTAEAIIEARKNGRTWRQIAATLEVTEMGARQMVMRHDQRLNTGAKG